MARRRYNNRGRSSSGTRRRLFWARRRVNLTYTDTERAYPTDLLSEFQAAYDADLFGFTVTRVLGTVVVWTEENNVETSRWFSLGFRVADTATVDEADTDAEQLNLTPNNNPFADWMYARNQPIWFSPSSTGLSRQPVQFEIDNRSQRRLDELGQSLYAFSGVHQSPPSNVQAAMDLHVLCKRP